MQDLNDMIYFAEVVDWKFLDSLADALEHVVTNPEVADRLASAACARAHTEFALDVSSARLASLFRCEVLR